MLTFWDTKRGVQLADTLIKYLPKLANKKQYTVLTDKNQLKEIIDKELKTSRLVNSFDTGDKIMLVFEK